MQTRKGLKRPDALIITNKSELTYLDILCTVKADTSPIDLRENVTRIRRTQKSELLRRMISSKDVKLRRNLVTIECKELKEITNRAQLCKALRFQLGSQSVSMENIIRMRKTYGKKPSA